MTVRALAHLIGKTFDMPRCNKDRFLPDGGALDLVISLPNDVKIPPDILHPPLHHRAERAVIDEPCNRPVAFRCGPDKPAAFCQIHHFFEYIAHDDHRTI